MNKISTESMTEKVVYNLFCSGMIPECLGYSISNSMIILLALPEGPKFTCSYLPSQC